MITVWGCVLALLLDLFDKFERRYAIDLMHYQLLPDRWVAWGWLDPGYSTSHERYFLLHLPSYSYEYNIQSDDYAWGRLALLWVRGRGWRRIYFFE